MDPSSRAKAYGSAPARKSKIFRRESWNKKFSAASSSRRRLRKEAEDGPSSRHARGTLGNGMTPLTRTKGDGFESGFMFIFAQLGMSTPHRKI